MVFIAAFQQNNILGGNTMKKFIAPILTLTMVFSTAIAVSAAPAISGEVEYKLTEHASALETEISMDGKLNTNIDYNLTLESDLMDLVQVDEASLTYKSDLVTVQVGQFGNNPSVMDMMDGANFHEMKAPFAVNISPNLGEKINLEIGVQSYETVGDLGQVEADNGAYQIELDYKISPMITVGVNYQDLKTGDAALVWQVEAQPTESVTIYGEYGNPVNTSDEQALIGAAYTQDKVSVRGEYNLDNDDWAAKVGYNVTKNISAEFKTNSADFNQLTLGYTF